MKNCYRYLCYSILLFMVQLTLKSQAYVIDFDADVPIITVLDGQNATITGNVLNNPALTDSGFDYIIEIQISGGPVTNAFFPAGFPHSTAASEFYTGAPSIAPNGGFTNIDLNFAGHWPPIQTTASDPTQSVFYRDPTTLMEVNVRLDDGCSFENLTYIITDIDYTFNNETAMGEPNNYNIATGYIDQVEVLSGAGSNIYTPSDPSKVWVQGDSLISQFIDANNNGIPDTSTYGLIPSSSPDGNVEIYNPGNIGTSINFLYNDYGLGLEGDPDGYHDFDAINQRVGLASNITFDKRAVTDLTLDKSINTSSAMVGDIVVFTIEVTNESTIPATGVTVTDVFPAGLSYNGINTAPTGTTFNGSVWNIGTINAGQTMTLTVEAEVLQQGVFVNKAEITTTTEIDIDSTPNNDDSFEDDYGTACVSVPIEICQNQQINVDLVAPSDYTMYQWYLDGNPISGATSATYNATQVGEYTYTADGGVLGDCIGELCCPIQITTVDCCPTTNCLPITINIIPN